MLVIVPCNNKGGVGKTSVSSFLADYFSKVLNKRTLLIDLDPQCNLSQRYLKMEMDPSSPECHIPPIHPDFNEEESDDWDGRSSIADIFLYPQKGIVPYPTLNEHLDVMPAHASNLLEVEQCRKEEVVHNIHNRFAAFLTQPDVQAAYDFVVIDTAPSKGSLTRSAMRAASHIIIPAVMEDKSIKGVFGMLQLWMQESTRRVQNNQLNLIGILPNMFDSRTILHKDLYDSLLSNKEIRNFVLPCKLSRLISFAENDCDNASPKSLFDLPSNNKARQEVTAVCELIMERINATTKIKEVI